MPYRPAAASPDACARAGAGASAARKARFWDRTAVKYAAAPIPDRVGYETTLQRVRGLLSLDHDVLEIGCGTGPPRCGWRPTPVACWRPIFRRA